METVVRKRWLFGMQLLGFLILDQIPLMMVSVVQFSTENFWFRFVSGLVAVGLGAYFVYLFVAFLKKKKLITWTFLGIKETLPVVLLGLVIIFCVGIFGDFLLRLEGLETTSNQQSVEEIVQAIPKGLILIFAGVIGPIFEEGIFRVGIQAFFKPASKIGILVSSILFALVHTPTDTIILKPVALDKSFTRTQEYTADRAGLYYAEEGALSMIYLFSGKYMGSRVDLEEYFHSIDLHDDTIWLKLSNFLSDHPVGFRRMQTLKKAKDTGNWDVHGKFF